MSVSAKKDKNGTWHIQYRYKDWTGANRKSQKRGFKTKKEAEDWLAQFMLQKAGDLSMNFEDFWEIYKKDMGSRLRETTMRQKEYVVKDKLLPYFGKIPVNQITAPMIRQWQNEMMAKGYKDTYLKTINNQLSSIFNYAVRYYDLHANPCHKAGSMGKSKADTMEYWTLEEFNQFEAAIIDKRTSWIAFRLLFWTGMRLGEMLALTIGDLDFEAGTIQVSKSYTRMGGKDLVTPPKTYNSVRTITMPDELAKDLQEYVDSIYRPRPTKRIFSNITKSYIEHEMERGIAKSGVRKIHVHCLRHSHASMLVQMGFNPVEIADRLGHGKVTTTIETYCHPAMDAQVTMAKRLSQMEKNDKEGEEGENRADFNIGADNIGSENRNLSQERKEGTDAV